MCRFLKFLHIWRNFRCLPMTYVEKSEILHIWHVFDVENVAIYAKFMLFSWKNQFCENLRTLSRNPFCCNLRTFVWRKIYPKIFFVEKQWQIWGLGLGSQHRNIMFTLWHVLNSVYWNPVELVEKTWRETAYHCLSLVHTCWWVCIYKLWGKILYEVEPKSIFEFHIIHNLVIAKSKSR